MPSITKSTFIPSMVSLDTLDTLDTWTVLNILKQVRNAGYRGDHLEPIRFYRKALLEKMEKKKAGEGKRISSIYLAAEKALKSSEYDEKLVSFVSRDIGSEILTSAPTPTPTPTPTPPTLLVSPTTSCLSHRKKPRVPAPQPRRKSEGTHKPAAYRPPKKTIIKGFISKKPIDKPAELPLWQQPSLLGPGFEDTTFVTTKRKRVEESELEAEWPPAKVAKRGGWLY